MRRKPSSKFIPAGTIAICSVIHAWFHKSLKSSNFMQDNRPHLRIGFRNVRQRLQRPKVTIAIGLIVRGPAKQQTTIVFASDSQTTYPGGQKRLDAKKIKSVNFNDAQILVAQAGSAELADQAVEIMRQKAETVDVSNEYVVGDLAKAAVREIRNHLFDINKINTLPLEEQTRFWRENHAFDLLLGFYFNGDPYMYSIDLERCYPIKIQSQFSSIGCGQYVADFLLSEYQKADPKLLYGYPALISIIQRTIDSVDGCNRPIWVGQANRVPPEVLYEYKKQQDHQRDQNQTPHRKYFKSEVYLESQESTSWTLEALKRLEPDFLAKQQSEMINILRAAWENKAKWDEKTKLEAEKDSYQVPPDKSSY